MANFHDHTEDTTSKSAGTAAAVLRQIMAIVFSEIPGQIETHCAENTFGTRCPQEQPEPGILGVHGAIAGEHISLCFALVNIPAGHSVSSAFVKTLAECLGQFPLVTPPPAAPNSKDIALWVEMKGPATPMGLCREAAFREKLSRIKEEAKKLQELLPVRPDLSSLTDAYTSLAEFLQPVMPFQPLLTRYIQALDAWVERALNILDGGGSLAVISPFPVMIDFCLAALATRLQACSRHLGHVHAPQINAKKLLELVEAAPGIIALSVFKLSLTQSLYEVHSEVKGLMASLAARGKGVVFAGSFDQQQTVFSGGQGGSCDPLQPFVLHAPNLPREAVILFAVHRANGSPNGLASKVIGEIAREIHEVLKGYPTDIQLRILPAGANYAVARALQGGHGGTTSLPAYLADISQATETLGGLSPATRRPVRLQSVQKHFCEKLTGKGFPDFLRKTIWGQDAALDEMCDRLCTEVLPRPLHQPIRCFMQGTSGTAKSLSVQTLAEWLGVPYINIDAASMSDSHTASAQLLGSGRGLVGSFQSGRLEQVAKHYQGAVIEVSDLDHAAPQVRSTLADLFLQVLENGEAQSATGTMFSCANIIFVFTINLPGGADEKVHNPLGFTGGVSRMAIRDRVLRETRELFSSAFLSRIGSPIIFETLAGSALIKILEQAVLSAVSSAAERLSLATGAIRLGNDVGALLLASGNFASKTLGARLLLEIGRQKATQAFLALLETCCPGNGDDLFIHATESGEVFLHPVTPTHKENRHDDASLPD